MEEQATKASLRRAIHEVRNEVEGGSSLSVALSQHARSFRLLMIAMVRAGETGGFLDNSLEQVAVTLEKESALRGKIKGALTYPAVVLAFTAILIAAVLIFIVPIFEKMFHELGGQLPLPTRLLVSASNSLVWSGPLIVVGAVGGTTLVQAGCGPNQRCGSRSTGSSCAFRSSENCSPKSR